MDKDLEDDPRVAALGVHYAKMTGLEKRAACNAVIGGLYRLWRYGDTHLGRHNRLKGALRGLAQIAEVTALPALLLKHFPPEWLRVHSDGTIELPDYAAKNNLIDRDIRREKGRDRVRKYRERKRRDVLGGNASQTVTAEALQRYESVTTGTGPGPGPEPDPPRPGPDPSASLGVTPAAPATRESFEQEFRARFGAAPAETTSPRRNGHAPEPPTLEELEAKVRKLKAGGVAAADIVQSLRGYGITRDQVDAWTTP